MNPFWSGRAQEEANLRALRPAALARAEDEGQDAVQQPVPGEDEETRMELEGERPIDLGPESGGLGRGRSPSRTMQSERFRTPASWMRNGTRSSGPMPEEKATEGPFQGLEQDRVDMDFQRFLERERMDMNFQRMLEQEVVAKLHEENMNLKQQMAQLMREREKGKGQGSQPESSAWSEITIGDKREILLSMPKRKEDRSGRGKDHRYTPGGTQVPDGTPPEEESRTQVEELPPIPPWPWGLYEPEETKENFRWLAPASPRVVLQGGLPGGGVEPRHGRARDGGDPRHELWRGGIDSRHGQVQGDGSFFSPDGGEGVVTASEARTLWMEREVAGLRRKLESMEKVGLTAAYWKTSATSAFEGPQRVRAGSIGIPEGLEGARASGIGASEVRQGDRALGHGGLPQGDRALGHGGLPQGDRALGHGGLPQGDRALWHRGLPHEDRASWHGGLPQGDRALGHGGLPPGDRALWHGGLPHEDRASWHGGLPQEDRALGHGGLLQGDRALGHGGLSQGDRASEQHGVHQEDRAAVTAGDKGARCDHAEEMKGEGKQFEEGRNRYEKDEENLKSIPITLPTLAPPQGHQSSIDAGDWLAQVRPYVADVAPNAGGQPEVHGMVERDGHRTVEDRTTWGQGDCGWQGEIGTEDNNPLAVSNPAGGQSGFGGKSSATCWRHSADHLQAISTRWSW